MDKSDEHVGDAVSGLDLLRGVVEADGHRYLVRDELELIKEDRWGEEVWGVEDDKHGKRPGLVFYFGQNVSIGMGICCAYRAR